MPGNGYSGVIYFHKSVFEENSTLHLPDPTKLKSMEEKKKKEFKYMHQDGGGGSSTGNQSVSYE